jgi:hypothetical protein
MKFQREDEEYSGVPNLLADGQWLWFGDLPCHVENYNLKPSLETLRHMRENRRWFLI